MTDVARADSALGDMEKLFYGMINAWCWLRVAASLTLIGAGLGFGAFYLLDGIAGLVVGVMLGVLGLALGIRLAKHARRKGRLVEFAHGLPPSEAGATEVTSDEGK